MSTPDASYVFLPTAPSAWLTTADRSALLQRQDLRFAKREGALPAIEVDTGRRFQPIEGFGFALTGGSAMLISRLPAEARGALLKEVFSPEGAGIGASFLRLSIGASDLSERCFSYDDVADDVALAHFDLLAGDREVVPLLGEILAVNPALKIIAAPWSAPAWMKDSHSFKGGRLKPECQGVYAAYLAKYVQAMRNAGVRIHAITPQNEPLNQKNDPSMGMEAEEQAAFVKNHLGPALRTAGLGDVEIFCWDHNCDTPEYPLAVLADEGARGYLGGSAWHLYGGDISALSRVHEAHPEMKIYFTEQWVGADGEFGGDLLWHSRHVLIGALRNWSRVVLEWNLASDPFCRPHTPGGEARCLGALTIGAGISRNVAYYLIAHAAKFIRPGSIRIGSEGPDSLPQVAFLTPQGLVVLIVLNDSGEEQSFAIAQAGHAAAVRLPGRSLATYVWPARG